MTVAILLFLLVGTMLTRGAVLDEEDLAPGENLFPEWERRRQDRLQRRLVRRFDDIRTAGPNPRPAGTAAGRVTSIASWPEWEQRRRAQARAAARFDGRTTGAGVPTASGRI